MKETKKRSDIIKSINETQFCHASPVESDITPGFPDINACLRGIEINMELKYCKDPKDTYHVQTSQPAWTKARANAGGIVLWVLIVGDPREIFITLGCPHQGPGKYKFDRKTWTDNSTGCVVYEGEPKNWAKALFAAAQSLAG